ncbi:PH domain-containing protein [Domibacillus robiginosus]|uniref:PH domain-containing protein n=1 Tax=Domibacillus robiginosus TaxID=1071054 RepID=UPI00067CAAA0|nr:PH domain-containing protein [Domibacillus robiginosus]
MSKLQRRLHPAGMLLSIVRTVRHAFFPALFFFVFHPAEESSWIYWGRIGFLAFIAVSIVWTVLKWWMFRYEFREHALYVYEGLFVKSERHVPFSRIQNAQRNTSFPHRLLGLTALSLETGGEEASLKLEAVTKREADRVEAMVKGEEEPDERILHFQATNRELLKASFTSFSFFLIIPLLASLYFTVDDFLSLGGFTKKAVDYVAGSLWLLVPISAGLVILGIAAGIIITYLQYGNSAIMSDEKRIYLKKGLLNETFFTITREKVQAVKWKQSFVKKWFGLVEVELISAGDTGEEELETNSLYPFLPEKDAQKMIKELLPQYELKNEMQKLPAASLWIKLLRPSYIWIIATAVLLWQLPAYWYASPVLLFWILLLRWLAFKQARYTINGDFIQLKTGSLFTELLLTTR